MPSSAYDQMNFRILHVEDDPDILEIAKLALVDVGGLDVLQCHNGQLAMEKAQAFAPDLLLLDVMMPEISGIDLLKRLRVLSGLESVPAVFMTARAQTNETAELRAMGAVAVVVKPFDPMQLALTLRKVRFEAMQVTAAA